MTALQKSAASAALLAGAVAAMSFLTYGRSALARFVSERWAEAVGAVTAAELRFGAAGDIGARTARLGALSERRIEDLRHPVQTLIGAHDDGLPDSAAGLFALERALHQPLYLVQIYNAWGDGDAHAFPHELVHAIWAIGSVPLVTWEPWLSAFTDQDRPAHRREHEGLRDIAAGRYDDYIDAWAAAAAGFGKPIFVRFAHEMNDGYRYPWGPVKNPDPRSFVRAWRRVVSRFRAAGAPNVLWVWSPSISYGGYLERYPGDDVVDWVATGVLNYGTATRWSHWQSADDVLRAHYAPLSALGKPMMIAEFGSVARGGDRARWYEQALKRLPAAYPDIKALIFFHVGSDRTVSGEPLRWSFADEPAVAGVVQRGLAAWTKRRPEGAKGRRQ
ncbi:MAG TPA: glycosyl hydrolase [Polyangiaceae bacterium]|nr:glycosyl hydrolase [Polyangiaceae bacterium]